MYPPFKEKRLTCRADIAAELELLRTIIHDSQHYRLPTGTTNAIAFALNMTKKYFQTEAGKRDFPDIAEKFH